MAIGMVVAGFAARYRGAGAFYVYISRAIGPSAGFMAGWVYFSAVFVIACGSVAFLSVFASDFLREYAGVSVPWTALVLAQGAALAVLTVFDVRYSTRAQLAITAVSAVSVLACCAITLIKVRRAPRRAAPRARCLA